MGLTHRLNTIEYLIYSLTPLSPLLVVRLLNKQFFICVCQKVTKYNKSRYILFLVPDMAVGRRNFVFSRILVSVSILRVAQLILQRHVFIRE